MKILQVIFQNIQLLITKWWFSFRKRDNNIWVFGEWFGDRCCDNCMYYANYVVANHPDIKAYWISHEGIDMSALDERVERLIMDSKAANEVLKVAGVIYVVHDLMDITHKHILYYGGAVVVNFWHGIAWKKIGLDMPFGKMLQNYLKFRFKFLEADLYISPSFTYSNILLSAFSCSRKMIIHAGYPRNALFYDNNKISLVRKKLLERILRQGLLVDEFTKIIVYMPTFRDKTQTLFSFEDMINNEDFNNMLKNYNAIIVQKTHIISTQRSYKKEVGVGRLFTIPEYQSQELLASADILITDYSSCFFDYLLLDKPIIHFLYDYDYYADKDRGLYYRQEDVACGDVAFRQDQLISMIKSNLEDPNRNSDLRENRRKHYVEYDNSSSCSTIFKKVNDYLNK